MKTISKITLSSVTVTLFSTLETLAHEGHVHKIAGHSHYLGYAALLGAGALAAFFVVKTFANKSSKDNFSKENDSANPVKAERIV